MNDWTPYRIILAAGMVFLMGFVTAIPVGPTQLEIARRSLSGFFSSALMIIAGQLVSDLMYGAIALFGIAPFLQRPKVVAVFWLLNAVILAVFGIWAMRQHNSSPEHLERARLRLKKHNVAFFVGFTLAITNPFMIVWWLLGSQLLIDTGLIAKYSSMENVAFLGAGGLGLGSYLALLAYVVFKVKGFLSEQTIKRITLIVNVLLFGIAAYIGARAIFVLMG